MSQRRLDERKWLVKIGQIGNRTIIDAVHTFKKAIRAINNVICSFRNYCYPQSWS